ncbi:hypothetical protein HPO_14656, partial [Hyphomonas polymorpha PS728]
GKPGVVHPAVHIIPRERFSDTIFGYAYDTFISADRSEVTIRAPEYSGRNPTETFEFIKLSAVTAAVHIAAQSGVDPEIFRGLSIDQIIETYLDSDSFFDYAYSFASPGFIRARPREAAQALFAAIAMTMCANGLTGCAPEQDIYVQNSKGEIPADTLERVNRSIDFMKDVMTEDQRAEMARLGEAAQEKIGIKTSVTEHDDEPH